MERSDEENRDSGQDCDVGRHDWPHCTTTSKLQLRYRTPIAKECQKSSSIEV